MQAQKLLERLDKVRAAGKGSWMACCPAHDDKSPSLSITEADGKLLVYCHAQCPPLSVIEAVGLTWDDLFAESFTKPERVMKPRTEMDRVVASVLSHWKDASVDEIVMDYCKLARKQGETLSAADLKRERQAFERTRRAVA